MKVAPTHPEESREELLSRGFNTSLRRVLGPKLRLDLRSEVRGQNASSLRGHLASCSHPTTVLPLSRAPGGRKSGSVLEFADGRPPSQNLRPEPSSSWERGLGNCTVD